MTGEERSLGTSHVYGCEHDGCPSVGQSGREWLPGHGWITAYYCQAHKAEHIGSTDVRS